MPHAIKTNAFEWRVFSLNILASEIVSIDITALIAIISCSSRFYFIGDAKKIALFEYFKRKLDLCMKIYPHVSFSIKINQNNLKWSRYFK